MRNPQRISVMVDKLEKIWEMWPDLRFGQLVENFKTLAMKLNGEKFLITTSVDLFYLEDDRIIDAMDYVIDNESFTYEN